MKRFFTKLSKIIIYGGLSRDQYEEIRADIAEKNRLHIFIFSIISVCVFSALVISTYTPLGITIGINQQIYTVLFGVSIIQLIMALLWPRKSRLIANILMYTFLTILLGMGIAMMVSDISGKATMFLVFLSVIPLLFTVRPIHIISFEIIGEIIYIVFLTVFQKEYPVYRMNLWNSLIITPTSLIIGTNVIHEKFTSAYNSHRNKYLLETDVMTGLNNRRSFTEHIEEIRKGRKFLAIVSFDVNGLKVANDTIGHHAGDELICGAADCIKEAFGKYGICYRTGGDEYIAILEKQFDHEELVKEFNRIMDNWHGELNESIHISHGLIKLSEWPDLEVSELIRMADSLMYVDKNEYYLRNHLERRKS